MGYSPPSSRGLLGSLETTGLGRPQPIVSDAAIGKMPTTVDAAAMVAAPRAKPPARPTGAVPGEGGGPADGEVPLPPSRIPAAFHTRDVAGRLVFPSEVPNGDADVGLLAETLGGMLEEWRGRLEENKPSFPLGAARWGVLQMCIYDMWCTIEEARIWDIGLVESERFAHFYSPQLAAMLGRLRARLAQVRDEFPTCA